MQDMKSWLSIRSPVKTTWAALLAEAGLVAAMAFHGDFTQPGAASRFVMLGFLAGGAYWVGVRQLHQQRTGAALRMIWIGAIALRLLMLASAPGDDIWRYRWEGRIQLHGFNPYVLAPDAPALAHLRDREWPLINEPSVPAIYPPLTEMTFAALERVHASVLVYQIVFALADLGILGVLIWLLGRRGLPVTAAAWYAWNPLVVYISAGGAHFDSLMVLGMTVSVACLASLPPTDRRTWRVPLLAWAAAAALGLAIAIKATPLVLLPVFALTMGWRWSLCTLPLAIGITPLLATSYGFPAVPVFEGLRHFAWNSRLNDALWWLLDPHRRADNLCRLASAAVCLGLALWLRRDPRRACLWVLGAAIIFAPILHAWYLLWVLPLAVWAGEPAKPWFVFSISLFGYFLFWTVNPDPNQWWVEPLWMRALIYLPPLIVWAWMSLPKRRQALSLSSCLLATRS